MPTGYTADVVNGKIDTFEKFALQCARNFGALIMMRDDPMDAPIPEKFEPSDYNSKRLEEAKERLRKLQAMSPAEMEEACEKEYAERIAQREQWRANEQLENDRLDAMAEMVRAWTPPTANHTEMKSFMLDQIRISRHDLEAFDKYDPIEKLSPKEWYYKQFEKVHKDIGYHAGEQAKEIERAAGRSLWVQQLRDSLKLTSQKCEGDNA